VYFVRYIDTRELFVAPETITTDELAISYADSRHDRAAVEVLVVDGAVPGDRIRRVALLRS
jgi:hypothetical protein